MQISPEIVNRLRTVSLFANLDEESLNLLASRCRRRRFPAKEALLHEGDPGYTLYIVLEGHVHVQRINEMGQVIPIARKGAGEVIGELSLLDGTPRSADVVTEDACDMLMIDRDAFLECLDRTPHMARILLANLALRLRETIDLVDSLRSKDVLGRLCSYLLERAETQGERKPNGTIIVDWKTSQQDIADQVGTRRETVSRCLSRLKSSRIIDILDGHLHILQEEKLRLFSTL